MDVEVAIALTIEDPHASLAMPANILPGAGDRFLQDMRRALTWEGPQAEEEALVPIKTREEHPEEPEHQVTNQV